METSIDLFSVVLLLGAAHGLFLALTLLHAKAGNIVAHRMLAVLTIVFALDLVGEFLYRTHYYFNVPHLIWLDDPLEFLYGPLALFYVYALTRGRKFQFDSRLWKHFFAAILAFILALPFFTLNAETKLEFLYGRVANESLHVILAEVGQSILVILFVFQVGYYLFIGMRELRAHAVRIKNNFSYSERINLVWLRNFYLFLAVLYLLFILDMFFGQLLGKVSRFNDMLYFMTVIMFYAMGYMGLRQPDIFSQTVIDEPVSTEIEPIVSDDNVKVTEPQNKADKKYKTSALDANMSQLLLEDLLSHIKNERPYLDSKLALPELAKQMDISTNYLSQIINECVNKNFFDFINHYRIEEAKRRLANPGSSRDNILTIALDSGFNSKTAFYSAFKKSTGMTPLQYKKSLSDQH